MNKTIKFALLLSAITCISCNKTELTPTKWLNELSDKKVQSSVKVSDYVNSKSVWYNSNLESLNKDGFEVTAFNAVNNKMWQEHFIKSGDNFSSDKAMWTKAGKMNFYAAHPSTFSFDENQVLQQNTGTNSPLNYDPIVSYVKSEETDVVNFEFYHAASQVKMTVSNNSDWDVRVSGELIAFYSWGTFKWQEPEFQNIDEFTQSKKLKASCWTTSDEYFMAGAVGSTAGSINAPFVKGDKAQLLVTNVVPFVYDGHEVPSVVTGTTTYPTTRVRFKVYYQKNDVECTPLVYEKEIKTLVPGICYNFHLDIQGDYEPKALISTVTVDDFTEVTDDITVKPWETKTYKVTLTADETMGKVTGAGEVKAGEEVTISAVPNDGYEFVSWSDGSTEATRKITVTKDITLTATFAEKPSYSALYIIYGNEWQASKSNSLERQADNHTWKKTITLTDSNKDFSGNGPGFFIVSSTGYDYTAFYGGSADVLTKGDNNTYPQTLITAEAGTYDFSFNDKTLKYSLEKTKTIEEYKAELQALITSYENDDPNGYDYTEASLKAYNDALAAAKEALNSPDINVVKNAKEALEKAYKALTTGSTDVELPDIG